MLVEGELRNDDTQEFFSDIIEHSLRKVAMHLNKHGREEDVST